MLWRLSALKRLCVGIALWIASAQATVVIHNGTVQGTINSRKNVERFLGIPYAEPPTGQLRLQRSIPLRKPFGNIAAANFGHSCYGPYGSQQPDASEDCLTLNIWRPSGSGGEDAHDKLPVLVWFYGGGLTGGYTSNSLFEGSNLVGLSKDINKPIILVSVNYRLSAFGFLNGQQMAELGLLNLGMLDQRLALRWIQENIAAFGGDPGKVTLFGQSAGAVSIYSHLASYGGRDDGLYRGAILQSGGAFPLTYPNTTDFQRTFDGLITNTNCSSVRNASAKEQLECIRKLSVEEFRRTVGTSTGQSIDGEFSPTSIQFAFPAGRYVKVAVMVGSNTDEGTTSAPTGINTPEQLSKPLSQGFFRPVPLPPNITSALQSLYSVSPTLGCPYNTGTHQFTSGTLDKQACSIFGDLVQIAPARMIARALTATNGGKPVFRYRFNHLASNVSKAAIGRGIGTGAEQPYVFANMVPDTPWDQALAREVAGAWIAFAHDLDPNRGSGSALPFWPVYGDNASSIVFNGFGSSIEQDVYRAEGIDYIIDNVLQFGAH